MTVRRLCGYDLNGWSDRAARSWTLGADGDVVEEPHLTGRVLRSGVVRMATGKGMRWIGGAQASLAPHGRGGGWGEVGRPDRRRLTLDILRDAAADSAQLAAALSGLAERPGTSVLAIAEGPETSERLQERLVEAMGKARLGRGLLVWRSVLAVLAQDGLKDGMKVGVIGHVSAGFTLQSLRLRQVVTARGPVLAPERRRAADLVISGLGYDGLILAAERATRVPPDLREDWTVASRALAETALTGTAAPELYRNARGQFLHLTPPRHLPLPAAPPEGVMALADCDLILFETLTEGRLRQDLVTALAETLPCPLVACPPETVAQGALVAAKRLAQGLPVYFDFLPQISTIVLGAEGAQSYDLIEASATLPAGQIYRSAKPAHFAIQAGQASVSVHIRKELADWPRKARIELGAALPKATPVELRVEQAPASGRARLIVEAPSLARHFTLDWDAAEEIRRPWDALITELDAGEATIPARLVLPCGILAWEGSTGTDGLAAALEANRGLAAPDWVTLAERVKARPQKLHTISSDGDLPPEVPSHLVNLLGDLNARALEAVTAQARGAPTPNNAALIFLTWQFRNAPTELSHCLLEAMEARQRGQRHPFGRNWSSWTLVFQGFGRSCRNPDLERKAMSLILAKPVKDWAYQQETAALAFLLSRSDSAPRHLSRSEVERIADRVVMEFKDQRGGPYTKFNYAPLLLGGLLRWRLKLRNSLVLGEDSVADRLKDAIDATLGDLEHRAERVPLFQPTARRYIDVLRNLTMELEGRGSNPDILRTIYDVSKPKDGDGD